MSKKIELEEKIKMINERTIRFEDCSDVSMKVKYKFPNGNVEGENEYCEYFCGSHSGGYPSLGKSKIIRILWQYYKNKGIRIEDRKCLRHMCNNKKCININHLELGTTRDNMKDKIFHGESYSRTRKLTKEEVLEIRELYSNKEMKQEEIGMMYNLNRRTISDLTTGKTYKDIGGPISRRRNCNALPFSRRLSDKEVRKIKELYSTNTLTYKEINTLIPKASVILIQKIILGYIYKDVV